MIGSLDVRRLLGEREFSLGQRYERAGKVVSAKFLPPNAVEAVVSGSGGTHYRQSIAIEFSGDGSPRAVYGECSCPVGYNCKHVAAALLAAGRGGKEAADSLPPSVGRWLERMRVAAEPERSFAARLGAPSADLFPETRSIQRLLYVLRADAAGGRAEIALMRVYMKKDGEIGANPKEYKQFASQPTAGFLAAADIGILAKLSHYTISVKPRRYEWPEGAELRALLREIAATGRARALDVGGSAIRWEDRKRLRLDWEATKTGGQRLRAFDADDRPLVMLPFPSPVYLDPESGAMGPADTGMPDRLARALAGAPEIPAAAAADVAAALGGAADARIPPPRALAFERITGLAPRAVLTLFGEESEADRANAYYWQHFHGSPEPPVWPCARLAVSYEGAPDAPRPGEGGDIQIFRDGRATVIQRDRKAERRLAALLDEHAAVHGGERAAAASFRGGAPDSALAADILFRPINPGAADFDTAAIDFALEAVPALRAEGWTVNVEDSWPFRLHYGPVSFHADVEKSDIDWFSIALNLKAGDRELDATSLIASILERLPLDAAGELGETFGVEEFLAETMFYPVLADGTRVPITGEALAPFVTAFLETHGLTGFHEADSARAAALAEALEGCGVPWRGGEEILALGRRLRALAAAPEVAPPEALRGELRPYQRAGYGWLRALFESGFGGVLADDMGLGKTVQALALLLRRHMEEKTDLPSLLVMPTSLLGNWRREAARFAPDLSVLPLHGPDRKSRFAEIPDHHLVMTTYPLLRRDSEALCAHEYDLALLDEAQAAKNPASTVAKRIRDIRARHRVALTGTPMENNLLELWSLFDWLIPGFLGNRRDFTRTFRTPIEKRGDETKRRLLAARLKPFLLRRTKDEVAADLPPRTEIDEVVPLSADQRALYEAIRASMDKRVREAIRSRGIAGARITILDALLKLRQVCCDPRLVKLAAARKTRGSAKRARLGELIDELAAEGRKVLVFSQFVEMLRLIEADVRERGLDYAMLHGRTANRDDEIAKFQNGAASLFLIGLKAGGVGLNLTAADTVILYDPWWNPAVERQAMDRAHRIGQDKPVFVRRLIAERSVEASIRELQARKQAVADALFEGRGKTTLALTDEDIDALLAPIA